MPYTEAQRALALKIVARHGGEITAVALDEIRHVIGKPNLPKVTVWRWLQKDATQPKTPVGEESVGRSTTSQNLTGKQRAFCLAYVDNGFNGTKAARTAQYSGDDHALAVIGSRNLRNVEIRIEIERLLAEQVMGRNEVLARLADQATASLGDFLDAESLPETMRKSGKLHLLKKIKITNREFGGIKTQTIELELHDPQAALVQLGRHYKLFTDRTEIDMPSELARIMPKLYELFGSPSAVVEAFNDLLAKVAAAKRAAEDESDERP